MIRRRDKKLVRRFLEGKPVKKRHEIRLIALYLSGDLMLVDGKPMRRVEEWEK